MGVAMHMTCMSSSLCKCVYLKLDYKLMQMFCCAIKTTLNINKTTAEITSYNYYGNAFIGIKYTLADWLASCALLRYLIDSQSH